MSYSISQLQPVKNRYVIIEYEFAEIIPVLNKMIKKYHPKGMRITSIEGAKVTIWVRSWSHLEYLKILSQCAEAEALNVQPRSPQDYPYTSK